MPPKALSCILSIWQAKRERVIGRKKYLLCLFWTIKVSALQEAEDNLASAQDTLQDFRDSTDSVTNLLRTSVQVLGALIIICAVLGLLTLASRRMWLLMIFLFFSIGGSFVGWGMGGTGLLTNTLFGEACGMMEGYLNNKPNEWLDDALPCDALKEAGKGMYPAMEAANLAVDEANAVIQGMHLYDRHTRHCFSF